AGSWGRRDVRAVVDPPHTVIVRVGDKETPVRRDGDTDRCEELSRLGIAAVARITALAVARHGVDRSIPRDLADDVVAAVGDVQIAPGIQRDTARLVELRPDRWTSVSRIGCTPGECTRT